MIAVEVSSDDLVQTVRALRGLEDGKELRKAMRRNIAQAAKPMVPALRAKVRGLPSRGESARRGRPGLRASTAKATRLQVQMSGRFAGVTVRVDPKKMPAGMRNLPAYMEGEAPFARWRKPTFGRDPWSTQSPTPYFYGIARRYEQPVREAVAESIETIQRQINT